MRLSLSVMALAGLFAGVSAGHAKVVNYCDSIVWLRSVQPGGETEYVITIPPGNSFEEPYLGVGRAIKVSKEDLATPGPPVSHLILGYTWDSNDAGVVWLASLSLGGYREMLTFLEQDKHF
jgi:hypothetical protein